MTVQQNAALKHTGVFFEKADNKSDPQSALNSKNAAEVLQVIENHNQHGASVAKKSKFFRKNIIRVEETLSSLRLGAPAKIGEAVLSELKGS